MYGAWLDESGDGESEDEADLFARHRTLNMGVPTGIILHYGTAHTGYLQPDSSHHSETWPLPLCTCGYVYVCMGSSLDAMRPAHARDGPRRRCLVAFADTHLCHYFFVWIGRNAGLESI
jgi:hypothetical protein